MSEERGRVVASHGRRVLVETARGGRVPCTLLGRRLEVVCGDEVRWRPDTRAGHGIVVERLPRRSALERTNARGRAETLVANLTQLLVVFAHEPRPDYFIVDRYVAAAELLGLRAIVARNKSDAGPLPPPGPEELANYARLGYPTVECSALDDSGVTGLEKELREQVTVLVGQSGVGKSSLANRLLPGLEAETAELSAVTEEGRHVTSVAVLLHLPGSGDLVDSPGVRDFAPAIELLGQPARGFREIVAVADGCRFADCRHLREPDCAVRAAVAAGRILERRYESYRRLSRLSEKLAPVPGSANRGQGRPKPVS
jgi:ribosome biogenesis GTPase